jgi:hypothetical protein
MKALVIMSLLVSSGLAHAAEIKGGRYNPSTKSIELDVGYGGGCGEHNFSLEVGGCLESFPVSCTVELVHSSDDPCEAYLMETVSISLASAGLDDSYYSGASLEIKGGNDSKVDITLPRFR